MALNTAAHWGHSSWKSFTQTGLAAPVRFALVRARAPPCCRQTSLMKGLSGMRMPVQAAISASVSLLLSQGTPKRLLGGQYLKPARFVYAEPLGWRKS